MNKKIDKHLEKEIKKMTCGIANPPKLVTSDKPITLYHGTSLKNFKKIMKQGIQPRRKKPSNWEDIGISRPDLVYLTNCYALYYASCAINSNYKKNKQVILKIKIDPKKIKLYMDEEFIYHTLNFNHADNHQMAKDLYATINPKNLNPLIKNAFTIKLPDWKDSLNYMGTVSCDAIPIENIIGYCILDKLIFQDPSISPLNYKIMSGIYFNELKKLKYKKL